MTNKMNCQNCPYVAYMCNECHHPDIKYPRELNYPNRPTGHFPTQPPKWCPMKIDYDKLELDLDYGKLDKLKEIVDMIPENKARKLLFDLMVTQSNVWGEPDVVCENLRWALDDKS